MGNVTGAGLERQQNWARKYWLQMMVHAKVMHKFCVLLKGRIAKEVIDVDEQAVDENALKFGESTEVTRMNWNLVWAFVRVRRVLWNFRKKRWAANCIQDFVGQLQTAAIMKSNFRKVKKRMVMLRDVAYNHVVYKRQRVRKLLQQMELCEDLHLALCFNPSSNAADMAQSLSMKRRTVGLSAQPWIDLRLNAQDRRKLILDNYAKSLRQYVRDLQSWGPAVRKYNAQQREFTTFLGRLGVEYAFIYLFILTENVFFF